MTQAAQWVRIEEEFDAPIETVWKMWAEPELFARWYGPKGFTVPVAQMDVSVGGTRKICMEMKTPEKTMTMWFIGVYKEVVKPNRLAYTESMCDADGNIIPPSAMGMPEGHPEVTEVVVELTLAGDRTRMVMTHKGVPAGTAGEGGWRQAIGKLGELLSSG